MYSFLFLEFIGTSELMVILVGALIVFGPRKLPELGRSLGQAMHQLRGASEDFKRTWETEAQFETASVAALAPAPSGEQADTTQADATQADITAEASPIEVIHAHPLEAQSPAEVSYAAPEAALVEA